MVQPQELVPISVDGVEFGWRVDRNPQWCTADGWRGLLLYVEASGSRGRSLHIELPFEIRDHGSTPHRQRPKVSAQALSRYIREALEAGWDPSSRGKTFLYVVAKQTSAG
jgi:hypothetical protein